MSDQMAYALAFFLGIVLYSPILLFSRERYKSGLKCAAAICLWLSSMVVTVTVLSRLNPELMRILSTNECTSGGSEKPSNGNSYRIGECHKDKRRRRPPSKATRFGPCGRSRPVNRCH